MVKLPRGFDFPLQKLAKILDISIGINKAKWNFEHEKRIIYLMVEKNSKKHRNTWNPTSEAN